MSNLKKNVSLKKQVKLLNLMSFLDNYNYVFVLNDLSLNSQQVLSVFEKDSKVHKMVIKSKVLLKVLVDKKIIKEDALFIKGPVLLVGTTNIISFKALLNFIEIKATNSLDLIFIIANNLIIKKSDVKSVFINFFKNLNIFQYSNCLSIKYRKELLNSLLFSTFYIESKLLKNLKLK